MRVFIDDAGNWYKAEEALSPSHAERICVTEEFLEALSDKPQELLIVNARVQQIINEKVGVSGDTGQIK